MTYENHVTTDGDRLLASVARRGWTWLAVLGAGSLALTGGALLFPAALGHAVDAAISRSGDGGWLTVCALLVTAFAVAEAATELAVGTAGANATARLRGLLAAHVLSVGHRPPERGGGAGSGNTGSGDADPSDAGPYDMGSGDTVSRVTGSASDAGDGPASLVSSAASALPAVGALVALGLIDPWLVLAFAIVFPALALMLRGLARDSSRIAADYGHAQGTIASRLIDALAGARTIAAAGSQAAELRRILAPLPELRSHGHATWRVQGRAVAQSTVIAPVIQVVVVAVAGLELARHRLTPGGLTAAIQYAMLATGIGASTAMVARLGIARGGARRVAELLSVPAPEYPAEDHARPRPVSPGKPAAPGELAMRGVTVRRGGETVLRRLDLIVPGGAVVAVVGRSGAGKSTLAELAGRLCDPDEGSVLLDGADLRRLTRATLRERVVYAFERPFLLGATPGEAIGFGPSVPLPGDITTAAANAQAARFIERLPLRYDTPLEEAPLSGGEVQRLGLARAFAHAGAARLLVLDDATSSLDTVTEMLVSRAMTERLHGRTRLIVAHRAATAARADLVAWLDEGRIRALAPHDELWLDPAYREMFAADESDGGDPC